MYIYASLLPRSVSNDIIPHRRLLLNLGLCSSCFCDIQLLMGSNLSSKNQSHDSQCGGQGVPFRMGAVYVATSCAYQGQRAGSSRSTPPCGGGRGGGGHIPQPARSILATPPPHTDNGPNIMRVKCSGNKNMLPSCFFSLEHAEWVCPFPLIPHPADRLSSESMPLHRAGPGKFRISR